MKYAVFPFVLLLIWLFIYNCRVSGLSPFMGDTDLETMANVTIAEYDYLDEAFEKVSDMAKDFIDKLLIKEKEWVGNNTFLVDFVLKKL